MGSCSGFSPGVMLLLLWQRGRSPIQASMWLWVFTWSLQFGHFSSRRRLRLGQTWLEMAVEETDERGNKRRTTVNKDSGKGTPQGAPISPLIYHTGQVRADGMEKIKTQSIRVMAKMLREFVSDNEIGTLNVEGPRASKEPGIGDFVREVLEAAFPR